MPKSLKSVHFLLSYSKYKRGTFLRQCIYKAFTNVYAHKIFRDLGENLASTVSVKSSTSFVGRETSCCRLDTCLDSLDRLTDVD